MITIKEIAQLAGTSRGTVDRVLNQRGNVKSELAQRILQIAEEHDYSSNPFAKALVSGKRKYLIGVVINSKGNKFFDDVLSGIHATIQKYRSYGMEVHIREIKGYNEREQLSAIDELLKEDLDALVLTPMDTPAMVKKLSSLAPLPIVTLNNDLHLDSKSKLAFIGCDYLNSGRLSGDIANLALGRGGRVGIVTGSFSVMGHNDRITGFRQAVSEHTGIEIIKAVENNDDNDTSYQVTTRLIAEARPDLIYFCAAGTEGGVAAVKDSGKPIKVIVVDDLEPMRRYLASGDIIAIVTQQPYRQGSTMVEILYQYLISGKKPEHIHNYMDNQVKLKNSK